MKAPEFPWEKTDKKNHQFIYSLLCHDKPLAESNVFEEAYKLNTPLWAAVVDKPDTGSALVSPIADHPPLSFFELVDSPNCLVTAFKRCERDQDSFVLRLAEVRGEQSMAVLKFNPELLNGRFRAVKLCNTLERELETEVDSFDVDTQTVKVHMGAYKVVGLLLHTTDQVPNKKRKRDDQAFGAKGDDYKRIKRD